jgi:hypothetical protein
MKYSLDPLSEGRDPTRLISISPPTAPPMLFVDFINFDHQFTGGVSSPWTEDRADTSIVTFVLTRLPPHTEGFQGLVAPIMDSGLRFSLNGGRTFRVPRPHSPLVPIPPGPNAIHGCSLPGRGEPHRTTTWLPGLTVGFPSTP